MTNLKELSIFDRRDLGIVAEIANQADPIWGEPARVYRTGDDNWVVLSERAGRFAIDTHARSMITKYDEREKVHVTRIIFDQHATGHETPLVTGTLLNTTLNDSQLTFSQRVGRFFRWLAKIKARPGQNIHPLYIDGTEERRRGAFWYCLRMLELGNPTELDGFISALSSDGLVEKVGGIGYNNYRLTADGLRRLEAFNSNGAETDQVFVAMWFDESMKDIYEHGIKGGIEDAGWQAFRIDGKEHVNKIDDEIVAEIRRSRFLVADFTCGTGRDADGKLIGLPRGGVYFEAGFARGLGMEVIWTVREGDVDNVHFDTRQFNHIVRKHAADLRKRLRDRIIAVMGEYRR